METGQLRDLGPGATADPLRRRLTPPNTAAPRTSMGDPPQRPFVPAHFALPEPPRGPGFVLTPLSLSHNERDLHAWSSSVNHIHATAGFAGHPWPDEPMTLERNARDLQEHEDDFAHRRGFTYSVLSEPGDEVIGCVYIYPSAKSAVDAAVRSWVRATRAGLDAPLYATVYEWLQAEWPFDTFDYAPRQVDGLIQPGDDPPATS
jgi:hypothetical protein